MNRTLLITCVLVLVSLVICVLVYYLSKKVIKYKDVRLDAGPVRGFVAQDGDYFAYLGIPYAVVGSRRYQAPLPPVPWDELLIADRFIICEFISQVDENCLVVNVYTPTKVFNLPLPVLVYIHPGGFASPLRTKDGFEPLIKQNIIVVTLTYRLGPLGFLCLGTKDAPGNAGLKDQVKGLKWIQRNINKFGGDPKKVTIYGMSAGAASVEFLTLSRMAEGLFHRAIIESGSASAVWSLALDPIEIAKKFVLFKGFPNKTLDWHQLINFYQTEPAKKLSETYSFIRTFRDGTFGFAPCLENKIAGVQPFQWDTPQNIIESGSYSKVPKMFIFASLEGLYFKSNEFYSNRFGYIMNERFHEFIPADLIFDTKEIFMAVSDEVKQFYFGDKTINENTLKEYFDYNGDILVLNSIFNSVVEYSKKGDVVFLMEYAYKGNMGKSEIYYKNFDHSGHGDAWYTLIPSKNLNEEEKLVAERMTKLVANFMEYGNPNPARSELIPVLWPAVQSDSVTYLRVHKDLQVLEYPSWQRKLFWDKIYKKYRRPVQPVDPKTF